MQSPLWILNNFLLVLFIALLAFAFYSRVQMPKRKSIEPVGEITLPQREGLKVDPARIYSNDLFGTLAQPIPQPTPVSLIQPLPEPPSLYVAPPPPPPPPKFLDPLKITLRGIMNFGDETQSRAVIADESDRQKLYGIGDKIDDAYLIRIFENRILLIRSNGQQETVYLRESDAETDRTIAQMTNFDHIVRKISETSYIIDPKAFVTAVETLAQLVEALDLSSVLSKGKSFGCRIGSLAQPSLGSALGFQTGDIIRTINGMPAGTTKQRLAIYNTLTSLPLGANIDITLLRHGTPITLHYTLEQLSAAETPAVAAAQKELQPGKLEIIQKKETFAPTINDYKKREQQMMLQKGKRRPLLKNIV